LKPRIIGWCGLAFSRKMECSGLEDECKVCQGLIIFSLEQDV